MPRPKLWKYLEKDTQTKFYETAEDPEEQTSILGIALDLPEFKGDARSAIKVDYVSYNLSFAQECGFSATQTSAFITLTVDLLELIKEGKPAAELLTAMKEGLLPLLSVKSAATAAFSPEDQAAIDEAKAAETAAKQELEELVNPPPPPPPPEVKGKKAPPPPPEPEPPDPDKVAELEAVLAEKTKMYKEVLERAEEGMLSFSPPDVKKITDYIGQTLLSHLKLYQYALTTDQEMDVKKVIKKVETTIPAPPLALARTDEELAAYNQELADIAAAEKAEQLKKEEEERVAAEKAAEEAAIEAKRLAEEELRKRQPTSIQDAVEKAVAVRLLDEKAKLQAEYKAREEQLMQKIRNIEAMLGTA